MIFKLRFLFFKFRFIDFHVYVFLQMRFMCFRFVVFVHFQLYFALKGPYRALKGAFKGAFKGPLRALKGP